MHADSFQVSRFVGLGFPTTNVMSPLVVTAAKGGG